MVQYASVFYGTELSLIGAWGQVECFGPTCSETEILNSIKNARLVEVLPFCQLSGVIGSCNSATEAVYCYLAVNCSC